MITNQKIELIDKNKIKFEWEWTNFDGFLNIYIQKFQDQNLEKLESIFPKGRMLDDRMYEREKKGLYRIVAIPVYNGIEDKVSKIETDYICIGGKNILEYSFKEAEDMSCFCIKIQRLDMPIKKELVYLESRMDGTKIPFTADLKAGQEFYIANCGDLEIKVKYPYSLELEVEEIKV